MVVLSNHRLGRGFEMLAANAVASRMLRAIAAAAATHASSRWEHELVRWLELCAASCDADVVRRISIAIDIGEIAWSRDHFAAQKQFLIAAILRTAPGDDYAGLLRRWRELVEAHPAASVQVGRRWNWHPTA
jgi:hypothetical protein